MQRCYTEPSPSLSALMETERGGGRGVGEKKGCISRLSQGVAVPVNQLIESQI